MDPAGVRTVIEALVATGEVVARSDGSHHQVFPVAPPPREGEDLRRWVVDERATRTIEIGLGYGVSALYVCEGLLTVGQGAPRHLAVDPYQRTRFAGLGLQVVEEAGVASMLDHRAEESQTLLPRLVAAGDRFDVAFVDGNHRFDWFFVDLFYLARLLRPGAVVVVDDYQLPAIARAVEFFVRNRDWRIESVSDADDLHQWAALRAPAEPEVRPFDHFVDFSTSLDSG